LNLTENGITKDCCKAQYRTSESAILCLELKKLQARNEKETGIEFVIGDKNNYQDFIALIDAMKMAKQESYGVDVEKTNHFFAVHMYKRSEGCRKRSYLWRSCRRRASRKKIALNFFNPETFINHVLNNRITSSLDFYYF
jgi:hypothetical protein